MVDGYHDDVNPEMFYRDLAEMHLEPLVEPLVPAEFLRNGWWRSLQRHMNDVITELPVELSVAENANFQR